MAQKIVVIDDSKTICSLLEMHLRQAGYQVQSFQDPRDVAKTFFFEQRPLPDLVIVDLILPYVDGYRLIERFRQYSKSLPILVLTRRSGEGDSFRAKLAGATAYVTKPFEVRDMLRQVQQLLKRNVLFQPNTMLLRQFHASFPHHQETLVDFGVVPQDAKDRANWRAEVTRFIASLSSRGYLFREALSDQGSGLCPLYMVRLDRGDFKGPTPADPSYLKWVIQQNRLCSPGQTTRIAGRGLEIHVLGDGQSLDELFKPKG